MDTGGGEGEGAIESVRINGVSVLGGPRIRENVRALFPPGKNKLSLIMMCPL